MQRENILIIGDSYSTFEGYVPEGYDIYYPRESIASVSDVSKTWWNMLESETNSKIIHNNSWSGSTICSVGWNGDCSTSSAFYHRLSELIENGFFEQNKIDRVFVFGGTNDSWIGTPCGEVKYSDFTREDLDLVLPAYCFLIDKLLSVVSKECIHVILNSELREELCDGICRICEHYGIDRTELSDIDKIDGHPTYEGMVQIKNQILKSL